MGLIRTTVLVGAAALLTAAPTLADNTGHTSEQTKALYELQEKCGKSAAAFFAQRRKDAETAGSDRVLIAGQELESPSGEPFDPNTATPVGNVWYDYENNYSGRFNRCFILIKFSISVSFPKGEFTDSEELWDVNAHRKLGFAFLNHSGKQTEAGSRCRFNDTDCDKPGEPGYPAQWNALIKPYMQDSE
jgi:hypothetical protein